MVLKVGQIVKSTAGHDKGGLFVVAATENGKVLLCDGKERPIERPKKKNPKHIEIVISQTDKGLMESNSKLRKTLNKLANPGG